MSEYYIDEDALNALVEMIGDPSAETGTQLVQSWLHDLKTRGMTRIRRQLHSLRSDFSEKKAVIDYLGLPILQTKRAFSWNEPRPPMVVPDRLIFRSFDQVGYEVFSDTVAKAHQQTLDRNEQNALKELENKQGSFAEWLKTEFEEASVYFDYEPDWWQVAYNKAGQIVGYIQPVVFKDNTQENLREGTLYYMGVVLEARGNGYVNDLLAQSIATLQTVGVWRIYCDTDSENYPMIRAFEKAHFEEDGIYYIWQGELDALIH